MDLSRRFYSYYSLLELKRINNYISRALIHHEYSAFSLSILEYIDILNLSLEKARKLILSREQYYIDTLKPEYNIQKIAGSSLGQKRSEKTKALIRVIKSGVIYSAETKAKISETLKGRIHSEVTKQKMSKAKSGENHPNFGKFLSEGTKIKMSLVKTGENNPLYNRTYTPETKAKQSLAMLGENHPIFDQIHFTETKVK